MEYCPTGNMIAGFFLSVNKNSLRHHECERIFNLKLCVLASQDHMSVLSCIMNPMEHEAVLFLQGQWPLEQQRLHPKIHSWC